MVVFAISVFGTTLPHMFYGESLLNHMNSMQQRTNGPLVSYLNRSEFLVPENGTSVTINDLATNLCFTQDMNNPFMNGTEKSKLIKKEFKMELRNKTHSFLFFSSASLRLRAH